MGLFGGLFNKKNCAICGGEIGLLGNRKLEDGNLCKDCARKLSPWFSERRHSTVEQIARQLAYREDNLRRIPSFRETRSYGWGNGGIRLIIDDNQQAFMVTSSQHWTKDNPDIVDYACVTGCRAEIREDRNEIRRKGPDGHEESFRPPRYKYDYSFRITIMVNHPYFDDLSFTLDSNVKEEERKKLDELVALCEDIVETMTGTRPDYAPQVPFHQPFCMECGRDLPPDATECPFCHPAPIPIPISIAGQPRPMGMPQGKPMGGNVPLREPERPMSGPNRPQERSMGDNAPLRENVGPMRQMNGPQAPNQRAGGSDRPVPRKPEVKGERGTGRDQRPDLPPRGPRG